MEATVVLPIEAHPIETRLHEICSHCLAADLTVMRFDPRPRQLRACVLWGMWDERGHAVSDALRQANEDIAAHYPHISIDEGARIIAAIIDADARPLRRGGVAIRIPRWRRWWMRLMPKRGRLWLQRETLRAIDAHH